jgi:hypothetical protein
MDLLKANWRVVGAVIVALIWAAKAFGPAAVHFARNTYARIWPDVERKTTVLSSWPLLAIAILLGPMLFPGSAVKPVLPDIPQQQPDLFSQCGTAGRALLADELEAFASQRFDSDQAKEDAINDKIQDVIQASFVPVTELLADAIKANRVSEFAAKLRKGELNE